MPSAVDLIGRRAELAGLAELLDGPGGSAMVVLGEAGSGKTSLKVLDTEFLRARSKLGQPDKAVEQFKQALVLMREVGDRPMEAETLLALGDALALQGLQDAAREAWQQASLIFSAFLLPQNDRIRSRLLTDGFIREN